MKIKGEHQAAGVQLANEGFEHGGTVALVLRKPTTHESDKVAELTQKAHCEVLGLEL